MALVTSPCMPLKDTDSANQNDFPLTKYHFYPTNEPIIRNHLASRAFFFFFFFFCEFISTFVISPKILNFHFSLIFYNCVFSLNVTIFKIPWHLKDNSPTFSELSDTDTWYESTNGLEVGIYFTHLTISNLVAVCCAFVKLIVRHYCMHPKLRVVQHLFEDLWLG